MAEDRKSSLTEYVARSGRASTDQQRVGAARSSVNRWLNMEWNQHPNQRTVNELITFFSIYHDREMCKRFFLEDLLPVDLLDLLKWGSRELPADISTNFWLSLSKIEGLSGYFKKNRYSSLKKILGKYYLYRLHSQFEGIAQDCLQIHSCNLYYAKAILQTNTLTGVKNLEGSIFISGQFYNGFFLSESDEKELESLFITAQKNRNFRLSAALTTGMSDDKSSVTSALTLIRRIGDCDSCNAKILELDEVRCDSNLKKVEFFLDMDTTGRRKHRILKNANSFIDDVSPDWS